MSQELQSLLTYLGLILALALNVANLLRNKGLGRKDTADAYSALSNTIEDLALENRTLRAENVKLRRQLRSNGLEPMNGDK